MQKNLNDELVIDESMMTLRDMVNDLVEPIQEVRTDEGDVSFSIDSLYLDMPIQLQVMVNDDGSVVLGTTPPLYKLETSFNPVFHQLRFSFQKID